MKRKIALGPGAASLILIVVILSLCMLSMLMQIGSRNDVSLASRGTEMISRVYDMFSRSEKRLAKLDAYLVRCQAGQKDMEEYLDLVRDNLPEGYVMEGDTITWLDLLEKRVLTCTVRLLPPGETPRTEWVVHTFEEPSAVQATGEEEVFPE